MLFYGEIKKSIVFGWKNYLMGTHYETPHMARRYIFTRYGSYIFSGHLAGILVGLLYIKGPLKSVMDSFMPAGKILLCSVSLQHHKENCVK